MGPGCTPPPVSGRPAARRSPPRSRGCYGMELARLPPFWNRVDTARWCGDTTPASANPTDSERALRLLEVPALPDPPVEVVADLRHVLRARRHLPPAAQPAPGSWCSPSGPIAGGGSVASTCVRPGFATARAGRTARRPQRRADRPRRGDRPVRDGRGHAALHPAPGPIGRRSTTHPDQPPP